MRNLNLDILKVILAIFVLLLHTKLPTENYSDFILKNGFFRTAVPIFLVINGYYFFNIKHIGQLKKWAFRLLILYVVWMLAYVPFWKNYSQNIFVIFSWGYLHLWYLAALLVAGLVMYLLKGLSSKLLFFIALVLYGIGYGIQYGINTELLSFESEVYNKLFVQANYTVYRNFLFFALPFLILGFLIRKHERLNTIKITLPLFLLCLLFISIESTIYYKYFLTDKSFDLQLCLLFVCPAVFLFAKNRKQLQINFDKISFFKEKDISLFSTAIYLVHLYVIVICEKVHEIYNLDFGIVGVVAVVVLTLICSYFLVLINRKLKYLL